MQTVSQPTLPQPPGVIQNPHDGYQIHLKLKERHSSALIRGGLNLNELAPVDTATLLNMHVLEDVIWFELSEGQSLLVRVSEAAVTGSVIFFYHPNGTLQRVVPVERLNPGWVLSAYHFGGDLSKFEARLARMRSLGGRWSGSGRASLWASGGWAGGVVYTATGVVERVRQWQYSPLVEAAVVQPATAATVPLSQEGPGPTPPAVLIEATEMTKRSYQVGGLTLALRYVERLGLVEGVNRFCRRQGELSEGTVMAVLVINRLLAPCALSQVAAWVERSGLPLLLGLADPAQLNYDRLVDTLLAVYPHWHTLAAELTLRAVAAFGLKVDTIHYDLTSILFQGAYQDSAWVDYGYSRDHRPDKPQLNLGLSATAEGSVVLPGGSSIHPGPTNDATTTVSTHQQLHQLFQRTDLLVTGDRMMQSAENMLTIARAHGRFLGPLDWTPALRRVVAAIEPEEFSPLPQASARAGHAVQAVRRSLSFQVKEKLTPTAQQRLTEWRKKRGLPGRTPQKRLIHFRMRAIVILDPVRQQAQARQRQRRLEAYQAQLAWVRDHLGQGRYYRDPAWVTAYLADLATEFKEVAPFVQVNFTVGPEQMRLTDHLRPDPIAQAARLDGKWVLVTNQPPSPAQSSRDYMDWLVGVYHHHRHIERRMRNLKSDLPLRPLYLHRDEAIVARCFTGVVALMLYTLIERDCQAAPALVEASLTTPDRLWLTLAGFCLTVFTTPTGEQFFWFDTPTAPQQLLWQVLAIPLPGRSGPLARLPRQPVEHSSNP